jgi:hypothetical protein
MSRLFAVADTTGANLLSDSEIVSCVNAVALEHGVPASDIVVVATAEREHLRESLSDYKWSIVPTPLVTAGYIRQFISACSRQADDPYVIVFTYVGDVRKLEKIGWKGVSVTTRSFGTLRHISPSDGEAEHQKELPPVLNLAATAHVESDARHLAGSESIAAKGLRVLDSDASPKKLPRGLEIRDGYKRAGFPDLHSHARVATEYALKDAGVTALAEPRYLHELVGAAIKTAPGIIETWPAEQRPRRSNNLPWRSTFHLVVKLILETGVAIGEDGKPLRPNDAFRKVTRFEPDWRARIYAHLTKVLMLAIGQLSEADIRPVAGYWFFDDGHESLLFVNALLEQLVGAGELQVDAPEGIRTWSLPARAARLALV